MSAASVGAVGTAALVYAVDRHSGAYDAGTWGPLGAVAALAVFALLCAGSLPSRRVLAAALPLAGVGALSVVSVAWGGIGQDAWRMFDTSLLGALALVAGSLAFGGRPRIAVAAAIAAIAALAVEVLGRVALAAPADWFAGRALDGPVGYHNAQGILFVVGAALAFGELEADERPVRVLAAAAAVVCLAGVLLTQSRGALIALAAVAAVHVLAGGSLARLLHALVLVVVGAVLLHQLGRVDLGLLERGAATAALRTYAATAAGAAVVAGSLAALRQPRLRLEPRYRLPTAVVLACAAAAILAAVVPSGRIARLAGELGSDHPPDTTAGTTRFTSLSLNGRGDAWRVAGHMIRSEPLLGSGTGSFARAWTRDRHLTGLYIRQPHAIFLEIAAELGVGGLALWTAFLAGTFLAIRRARSPAAASAALALGALVLEASVDWTWSFPGIVVPVLLVAGAAAGPPARGRLSVGAIGVAVAATLAAGVAFALPWAETHALQSAQAAQRLDPARAELLAQRARSLAPTDPAPLTLLGRLAESEGAYRVAAGYYSQAAARSREPWVLEWQRARVLLLARERPLAREACRVAIAENPGEPVIRGGPCEGLP